MDLYLGIAAIVLLLEISRRIVGTTFTLVVTGFLLYMYFGKYFPDAISHKGYDLDRIVGHMYMTLEGIFGVPLSVSASFGIFGVPLSVSASFVMLFVVYGTFMDVAGAGGFWLDLSMATMGRKSASAGRGAVITSALLGGPQGSGVATTMSVTPIMWPILKKADFLLGSGRHGDRSHDPLLRRYAVHRGTGGAQVPFRPPRYRSQAPETEAKTVRQVMLTKGYHLVSIVVLVALLVLWNKSPEYAALGGIATVILTSFLSRDRNEWLVPRKIIVAMIEGAKNMLPVAVLLAAAGLIVGTFTLTGLGLKISSLIMSASGGSVLAAILLSLVASM
ncbi:MAG: transporter, fusion protein, partial [Deltaproteobacteria bacterium]|nr:transporter, fusion protein [Deltaproteobacteria bacterium]